jgi:hypothetical protein
MKTKSRIGRIVAVFICFTTATLIAPLVSARMIGGPSCTQSQIQLHEEALASLTYHLDCGDEQAEVMEAPNPVSGGPRAVIAGVKQRDGNKYLASDGAVGKTITVEKGNHLPKGSEGAGQGRINVLGETWDCNRVVVSSNERQVGTIAKSECEIASP